MRAPNLELGLLRVRCDVELKSKLYKQATSLRVGMDALVEAVLSETEDEWLKLYVQHVGKRADDLAQADDEDEKPAKPTNSRPLRRSPVAVVRAGAGRKSGKWWRR